MNKTKIKFLLTGIALLTFIQSSVAQQFNLLSQTQIQYANIYQIIAYKNHLYIAGSIQYPGNKRYKDGLLAKLTPDLNYVWKNTPGTAFNDELKSFVIFKNKIYAVGESWEKPKQLRSQVWIVIASPEGKIISEKFLGDSLEDTGNKIIADNNNLLIAGMTRRSIKDLGNIWLIKINPQGDVIWNKIIGSLSTGENALNLTKTSDSYIVIAKLWNWGISNINPWILKLNKNFNIVWDRKFTGSNDMLLTNCLPLPNSLLFTGNTWKNKATNKADLWLVKLSYNGQVLFDKTRGTYAPEVTYGGFHYKNNLFIYGGRGFNPHAAIWQIDTSGQILSQSVFQNLPPIRSATILNNKLFIAGGRKQNGFIAVLSLPSN